MNSDLSRLDVPFLIFPRSANATVPILPDAAIDQALTLHASFEPMGDSTSRATGKKRGEAAEAAFLARATYLGFSVLHPWGESNHYDAAVDLGRKMLRVQVKSAAAFHDGYTIKATGANGHVYTADEIDFLVGYIVPENIWYIIPVESVGSRGTIKLRPHSRRLKRPIYERYREAWCLLDCSRRKRGLKDIPTACRSREVGVVCEVCPLNPACLMLYRAAKFP